LKETGSTNKEIQEFLKRYIEIESEKLELDKAKLEADFKKSGIRDGVFQRISPLLSEYLLRLKNLKTSFETNTEIAFVSNPGIENLNKAVRAYNPLFDTISNNYKALQKEISSGWNENLSEKFGSAVNYMIDEVHKPYVLQLNECIRMINEVKLKIGEEDEQQVKKEKIRQNVSSLMKNLDLKIPILESRFNELLTALQFAQAER
jgi:iron-sulfur cluster repair protein YtfE (RIC family)